MWFMNYLAKIEDKIGNVAPVLSENKHKLTHILRNSGTGPM